MPDRAYILLISATGQEVAESSVSRVELREEIENFREAIWEEATSKSAMVRKRRESIGKKLAEILIGPLQPKLGSYRHLVIIPNADLHFLPFDALPSDPDGSRGPFLGERYTVTYLSASSLMALTERESSPERKLLALADPMLQGSGLQPLEGARKQVEHIGSLFPERRIYTGSDATRARLLGQDLRGWHLHLAMHGEAGKIDKTRLALSDGFLSVSEVWGLYLDGSPLVVLSACETNLGERVSGDEVVSLANGFLYGGARSVVSTQWKVSDADTRILMESFYNHLVKGEPPAGALSHAKQELIQTQRPQPYFWAGFVMSGS